MAARGVNKVILVGNVGKDPEVRYSGNGSAIANLTLATSDSWTDQSGQKQEKTEWHRVVFFGKLAEVVEKYIKKGSKLYVEGKLQTRKWQGQDGQDKYTTEVVIDGFSGQMQMLDSRGGDQQGGGYQQQQQQGGYQQPAQQPQAQQPAYQQQPQAQQPAYQQPAAQPQQAAPAYQQPAPQAQQPAAQPAYQQPAAQPQQAAPAYQQPAQQRPAAQPQQAPAVQQPPAGFDDFDDDIPF